MTALPLVLVVAGCADAAWPDHLVYAQDVADDVLPTDNTVGSPSEIWKDRSGRLHATTVCGGFVALAVKAAYPQVTPAVLRALTGSASPNAKQWHAAIDAEASAAVDAGTFGFVRRASIDAVVPGDVLAAVYPAASGATGHVMIVRSVALVASSEPSTVPGVPAVDRWLVGIVDSTSNVHGRFTGSTDTRYLADVDPSGTRVDDAGVGTGEIHLLSEPGTGAIVGWTWSTVSPSHYQGTDPKAPDYRPIVAGWMTGPGL